MELPPDSQRPSPKFPFVLVEGNLGIPKKVLRTLYLAAVSMKFNSRTSAPREAIAATSTIILLNPAHQSALNTRKRLIEQGHLDAKTELVLTGLISRGSPEAGKQSIMWDHRRWCFSRIYGVMGPTTTVPSLTSCSIPAEQQFFPKITPTAVREELSIIQHTCQTYPRNYHAWAQWNYLLNLCFASVYLPENKGEQREFLGIILDEYARMRSWVAQHVSDYSAMFQLFQCQKVIDKLSADGLLSIMPPGDTPLELLGHALSLVEAFPTHESLWLYLRLILGELSAERRMQILKDEQLQDSEHKRRLIAWFSRETGYGPRK
ncbi:hypothetical protein CPC08DRAFT_659047 [Agrocybe pediades]|nr:hypothetical protein CPC08DRAFT_659047 [Agrocybe pediades]